MNAHNVNNDSRKKLVEELNNWIKPRYRTTEEIADFILERERKIVEPYIALLKEIKQAHNNIEFDYEMSDLMIDKFHKKIDEFLSGAGLNS